MADITVSTVHNRAHRLRQARLQIDSLPPGRERDEMRHQLDTEVAVVRGNYRWPRYGATTAIFLVKIP